MSAELLHNRLIFGFKGVIDRRFYVRNFLIFLALLLLSNLTLGFVLATVFVGNEEGLATATTALTRGWQVIAGIAGFGLMLRRARDVAMLRSKALPLVILATVLLFIPSLGLGWLAIAVALAFPPSQQ